MSFNGAGVFSIGTDGNPVVYDTVIDDTMFNQTMAELAAGLSTTICRDGQSVVSQDIPWNDKRLTNLGTATAHKDAASIHSVVTKIGSYCTGVGGTVDAYTLNTITSASLTAYTLGQTLWFKPTGANTGAVTVDLDGLGVKNVTKAGTIALAPGDLQSGELAGIVYDGTQFQLITPYYAEGPWTPSLGGDTTYTTQVGRYTKIGRAVHVFCHLVIATIGTGNTSVIDGLPFPALNLQNQALAVSDFASLATSVVWIGARVDSNAQTITLRNLTAAGASATSSALFGNGASITLAGTYTI